MNLTMTQLYHIPVLLKEVIDALGVQPGGRYIDCTVGTGGHAKAILEQSSPGGQLLGIDADPEAITVSRARLQLYHKGVLLVNENFGNIQYICDRCSFRPVHGILFDLGMSSSQLSDGTRGFSFQRDGPLDMRFDPTQELTAADLVNNLSPPELTQLFEKYGEERRSKQIARCIVENRPITTTIQLAKVVEHALGGARGRIHPATKTFQALRIAVNHELEYLEMALHQVVGLLGFGGRLVVISYHSLEDRLVKEFMRRESRDCLCPPGTPVCTCGHIASLKLVSRKIITPSAAEIVSNPRSRSARMRVAERI
jgi:16S rRNA (cytosine1402-N4)-methyltransferase